MAQKKTAEETQETGSKKAQKSASAQYFDPFSIAGFNGGTDKNIEKLMTDNKKQIDKFTQEAGDISREGIEAFIKSSTIFAKGFEDLARTATQLAQDSAEKQSQFIKDAMSAKTLNEWTEIQNKIAQANFDDFMAGATRISELSAKVLTESAEPINAQMTKNIKKASENIAA